VCTSCGGVVEENNLTAGICSSGHREGSSYVRPTTKERQQFNIRAGKSSMSRGRRQGLDLTKRIALCMDCGPGMTAEAGELFERAVKHPNFKTRRIAAKLAMAANCVYIVCRQHDWPVMLADVCGMVSKSIYAVKSWKDRMIATFPELAHIRAPDLFELLSSRCQKASVSSKVQQTAVAIVKLCRDLWVTEGRREDNIVIAALYIAWQSEEPVSRLKVKWRTFCRDNQLPVVARVAYCLGNMQETLVHLAEKIPWVAAESVNSMNIAFHVQDIISYRNTLIAEARADILRIQCYDDDDDDTANTGNAGADLDVACQSSAATLEMSSVGTDGTSVQTAVTVSTDAVVSNGANHFIVNTSKNESAVISKGRSVKRKGDDYYDSFWPPPGYQPHKRIIKEESIVDHPDLDCPHLSKHDIPEEDMHLYLKPTADLVSDENLQNDAHAAP